MSSSPFVNYLRSKLLIRSYSLKTEKSYLYFIRFHHLTDAPYQCKAQKLTF